MRIAVYNIIQHKVFEGFIILVIIVNSALLAIDDPTQENPHWADVLDIVFTAIFTTEMLLKMFALGVFMHKGSYLREGWNVLDFCIVILAYINFVPGFGNYTALRALRVMRPLRSMNAIPGLKVLVVALLKSVAALVHVMFLAAFIFAIFGILGVQLWSGTFRQRCINNSTGEVNANEYCRPGASGDENWGHECAPGYRCSDWRNPGRGYQNFDNVLYASLAVIRVMTIDSWSVILRITYDVTGQACIIYFFILVLVVSYFIPNLTLAVVNDKFTQAQRQFEKEAAEHVEMRAREKLFHSLVVDATTATTQQEKAHHLLALANFGAADRSSAAEVTDDGRSSVSIVAADPSCCLSAWNHFWEWIEPAREVVHEFTEGFSRRLLLQQLKGENDFAADVVNAATQDPPITPFTYFIIFCIVVNTVALASQHYAQPQWQTSILEVANKVLTAIFGAEMLLKLFGMGLRGYVKDGFNVLDGLVVIFSFVELALAGSNTVSVFRALRLLRVLKLLKNVPSLRQIIRVTIAALADTGYLNLIVLLYLFIAAVCGMQFFGGKFKALEQSDGVPIRAHFDSFLYAFYAVFQILTRDSWGDIMYNAMRSTGNWASLYFILVVAFGSYVLLNLFLTILISAFASDDRANNGSSASQNLCDVSFHSLESLDEISTHQVFSHRSVIVDATQRRSISIASVEADLAKELSISDATGTLVRDVLSRKSPEPTKSPFSVSLFEPTRTPFPHVDAESSDPCPACKESIQVPLPSPPLLHQRTVDELHAMHCALAAQRHAKQLVLNKLLSLATMHVEMGSAPPSERVVELAFCECWGNGLLLCDQINSHRPPHGTWERLRATLEEEQQALALRVGEEQVGGSLVAYVAASAPREHQTNGGDALWLFGPKNPFRVLVSSIVKHPLFDYCVLGFIVLSSLSLALDNPREDQTTVKYRILDIADYCFTTIFTVEMAMKIVATGFVLQEGAYLRDPWNWLDGIVVIVSIISIFMTGVDISFIKVFRTFRALRPLRVINRNRGLKLVVRTLLESIKGIMNVALLLGLNYLIFGILAVQLWNGKLKTCTDATIVVRENCTGPFFDVSFNETRSRQWRSMNTNFDHIGTAVLALFEVSAANSWEVIMWSAMDAVSDSHAPIRDYHPLYGLFFVVFFAISNFFLLNLFVGVVIYNFNSVKSRLDGLSEMTEEQQLWAATQRLMLNLRPEMRQKPADNALSQMLHEVVCAIHFEVGTSLVIFSNIILLACEHYEMNQTWVVTLRTANYVFVAAFFLEALLKLIAYSWRYFTSRWNQFDFFLVLLSIVDIILDATSGSGLPINPNLLRVFRIFRVLRILRLVKRLRQLRILVNTLMISVPSLINIVGFMLLLFFIFAVLAVQLFSKVRRGVVLDDRHINFHDFLSAIQLLFRVTTGDGWNVVMHDCMVSKPFCGQNGADDCGTQYAPLFFIPYMLLSSYVVTNLFIAIILDNFNTTIELEKSKLKLGDLHRFVDIWADFDEDASMTIPTNRLPSLLARLQPPLGITRRFSRLEIITKTEPYRIPEHGGYIHFVETLIPLARSVMGVDLTDREVREHEEQWRHSFPHLDELPVLRYHQRKVTVDQYFSSTYIAGAYKRLLARKAVAKLRLKYASSISAQGPTE